MKTGAEVQADFRTQIDTFGEDLTITPAGGGTPVIRKGVVRVASYAELVSWFDNSELGSFYRPCLMLRVRDDFDQVANSTFARDGINFTIRKRRMIRYTNTVVCMLIMASAGSGG